MKIVRADGVSGQKSLGNYFWDTTNNNWTTSKLKDMLNGIYYESGTGDCYSSISASQCDFNTGVELPKGLDDTARNMIDKEVIWNLGGYSDSKILSREFYIKERGTSTGNSNTYPIEWSRKTEIGEKHNGIGLIYPSDYGYAVGGEVRNICLNKILLQYDGDNCGTSNWLKPNSNLWTFMPDSSNSSGAFYINSSGYVRNYNNNVSGTGGVWPTLYLTKSVTITSGEGTIDEPYELQLNA